MYKHIYIYREKHMYMYIYIYTYTVIHAVIVCLVEAGVDQRRLMPASTQLCETLGVAWRCRGELPPKFVAAPFLIVLGWLLMGSR